MHRSSYTSRTHHPSRDKPKEFSYKTIRVHGLTLNVLEAHLKEIFGRYGEVSCNLPLQPITRVNKGYAILTYQSASAAKAAFDEMNEV